MSLAGPFVAVIPEQVRDLGIEAATVLAHLTYLTSDGPVVATAGALAEGTGLPVRTVQRATSRLRDRGLVTSERESTWNPTQRWTVTVSAGGAVPADVAPTFPRDAAVRQTANLAVTPLDLELEESTPLPPTGGEVLPGLMVSVQDAETAFAEWWSHYPRKDDRKTALRAYRTARKRASAQTLLDGLLAHLPAYAAMKADPDRRTYIPLASTWLNKERWLNDPPETRAPRRGAFDFTPEEMADIEARVASYGVTR